VNEVWSQEFIDVPPMPDEVKEILSDNVELANNLANLHGVLLPWATNRQVSSGQSKSES
jgi:hypothetical protein